MTATVASLNRKIKQLEQQKEYLTAEVEVLEMMVHDLAAPDIIRSIEARFPAIARDWAASVKR
jgi:cell division protein FtsB